MYNLTLTLFIALFTIFNVFSKNTNIGLDEYTFFAELAIPSRSTVKGRGGRIIYTLCGATLIHPRWLLSAARCFPNNTLAIEAIERSTDDEVFMGQFAVQNSIIKIYRHPNFKWMKYGNIEKVSHDIAVLKMRSPFKTNQFLQTILLPPNKKLEIGKSLQICKAGTIIGTGKTRTHYHASNRKFPFIKLSAKKKGQLSEPVPSSVNVFYTEVFLNYSHSLRANQGGPFVCNNTGTPIQYGVMSQQLRGRRTVVTVFEEVDKYMDFIEKHVPSIGRKWLKKVMPKESYVAVTKAGACALISVFFYVFLLIVGCFLLN